MKKFLSLLAVLGLFFAACGSDDSGDSGDSASTTQPEGNGETPPDSSAGGGEGITIADFAFDAPATVEIGTTLEVTNNDGATHTFTSADSSFDTGQIGNGGNASVTFENAGDIDFFCSIHPSMTGSITVEG